MQTVLSYPLGLRAESPAYTSPGQRPGLKNIIHLRPVRAAESYFY